MFETSSETRPFVAKKAQVIFNTMAFVGLHRFFPVHASKNYTLDLGFSNTESLEVIHANNYLVVPDRHHPPILLMMLMGSPNSILEQLVSILDHKNANYEELNKIFSIVNWIGILTSNDLDNSVSKFYKIVNNGVVSNVPKCKCVNFTSTYPVYVVL